ncbi:MAG: Tn3 family transposase [Isosphaeraceae bacterium]
MQSGKSRQEGVTPRNGKNCTLRNWECRLIKESSNGSPADAEPLGDFPLADTLREFLFFANRGQIRRRQEEEQVHQATCLNLLANAVIAWNTVYMAAANDRLRIDGHTVLESDLAHLSPCRYEHINPYGKYGFEMSKDLGGAKLRPLRAGRPSA